MKADIDKALRGLTEDELDVFLEDVEVESDRRSAMRLARVVAERTGASRSRRRFPFAGRELTLLASRLALIIFAAAVIAAMLTVTHAVHEMRETLDLFIHELPDRYEISMKGVPKTSFEEEYELKEVPEGFIYDETLRTDNQISKYYVSKDDEKLRIVLWQSLGNTRLVLMYTPGRDLMEYDVGGRTVFMHFGESSSAIWEENGYFLTLAATFPTDFETVTEWISSVETTEATD